MFILFFISLSRWRKIQDTNTFLSGENERNNYWIGLYDNDPSRERNFVWSSGESVIYDYPWHAGQPASHINGEDIYTQINWHLATAPINQPNKPEKGTWSVKSNSNSTIQGLIEIAPFSEVTSTSNLLTPVSNPSLEWGDYNNDGNLDILLTGTRKGHPITEIYTGDGNGDFTLLEDDQFLITSIQRGKGTFGDYDGDGDLDVILSGAAGRDGLPFAQVYRNNLVETGGDENLKPIRPEKLDPEYSDDNFNNTSITLRWNPSSDNGEQPQKSLTYNLKVGTTPGGEQIVSPLTLDNGDRLLNQIGNVGRGNVQKDYISWTINGLEAGQTYYWNVQAIDHGGNSSNFGSEIEQSFTVNFIDWDNPQTPTEEIQDPDPTLDSPDFITDITVHDYEYADLNNDGKLDLMVVGEVDSQGIIRLYYGDSQGNFNFEPDESKNIGNIIFSDTSIGDFNNDSYLDLLVVGGIDRNGSRNDQNYSGIFINNQGIFELDLDKLVTIGNYLESGNENTNTIYRQGKFGDYDNDGDLDVLLAGQEVSLIIENEGYNQSSGYQIENKGLELINKHTLGELKKAVWIDYDNDGDLDILFSFDHRDGNSGTELYTNNSYLNITSQNVETTTLFSHVITPEDEGTVVQIIDKKLANSEDENQLGGLDLFLDDGKIYHNIIEVNNTNPTAPIELTSQTFGTNVTLNWDRGTDLETPQDGLTYNLRVGTTPGGDDILVAKPSRQGDTLVSQLGNVNHNTSWTIHNLPDGIYYYSVQAIDTAYGSSEWSDERSFVIGLLPSDISDQDKPPAVEITDLVVEEGEGGATAEFTVKLTKPISNKQVKVQYETVDGSAIAGEDYDAKEGELTFAPNEVQKTITIDLMGDEIEENLDKIFYVNLTDIVTSDAPVESTTNFDNSLNTNSINVSNAVTLNEGENAIIKDFQGVATIIDDDVSLPDFAVTSFTTSKSSVQWTESFEVTWTIENMGDAAPSFSPYMEIYFSEDNTLDESDILVANQWAPSPEDEQSSLNFNPSQQHTFTETIQIYQTVEGPNHLILVVDPGQGELEKDEDALGENEIQANNLAFTEITLEALPEEELTDLSVNNVSVPASAQPNSTISVSWDVLNQSNVTTEYSNYIFISEDDTLDSDDEILFAPETTAANSLAGNDFQSFTQEIIIPEGYTEEQYLLLTALPSEKIDKNRDNNIHSHQILISLTGIINSAPALTGTQATLPHGTEDNDYPISESDLLQGFTDADEDALSVTSLSVINGTGTITGNFTEGEDTWTFNPNDNVNGTVTLSYRVSDGNDETEANQSFTINAVNDIPTITNNIPNQTATEDSLFTYQVPVNTFTDEDGDSLTYTATLDDGNPLPSWLDFNPFNLTFSGTPLNNDVGTITVKVTAKDTANASVDTTFELVIVDNDNQGDQTVEVILELVELDSIPGLMLEEEFELKVRFHDLENDRSVVSGYADIEFDPNLLQVIAINHDPDYNFQQTGTIENNSGIVEEVGGFSFSNPEDDTVFTLIMKAIAEGNTTIISNAGENQFSEISIIGSNDDQRNNTTYGNVTLAIADNDNQGDQTVEVILELVELDSIPGLMLEEEFELKVRFHDLDNDRSVVSGYADIEFDPNLLQVIAINHDPDYNFQQTGTIENNSGIVEEVGGFSFSNPEDDTVFTLRMKVIAEGNTTIISNAGEAQFSEITITGFNDDQRQSTTYGNLNLEIQQGQPDIVATAFDAHSDHLVLGQTSVTFTLKNQGTGNASSFNVNLVYSDDDIIGNEDDLILGTESITGLTKGDSLTQSLDLQLPLDTLRQRAEAEDPNLPEVGTISNNIDYLGLIIDPEGSLNHELDRSNNLNQGKGVDQDDVTYFPWDIDGNGSVTPTDAIRVINQLGTTAAENSLIDLDFNGFITPTDAIRVINHLGYQINPNVIETV